MGRCRRPEMRWKLLASTENSVRGKEFLLSTIGTISALAYRDSSADRIPCTLPPAKSEGKTMITDARPRGDLVAALHLESLFNSGHLGSLGERRNPVTCAEPAIHHPNVHDAVQIRRRSALVERLAVRAQRLTIKTGIATAGSIEKSGNPTLRAAENVAAWRAYLPEDCVIAMIKDGWHWST
jgi:hypothetical protein